jgi:hypothetical protein
MHFWVAASRGLSKKIISKQMVNLLVPPRDQLGRFLAHAAGKFYLEIT